MLDYKVYPMFFISNTHFFQCIVVQFKLKPPILNNHETNQKNIFKTITLSIIVSIYRKQITAM